MLNRKNTAKWKTPRNIHSIRFSKNVQLIGRGYIGNVLVGWLRFKDGKRHRVAIKIFHKPLSTPRANQYQQTIQKLKKAGIRMPKMALLQIPTERAPEGEWVQVSELFGSAKGSRLTSQSWALDQPLALRKEILMSHAKLACAGFYPAGDGVQILVNNAGAHALVTDIDSYVGGRNVLRLPRNVAMQLKSLTEDFASTRVGPELEELKKTVEQEIKKKPVLLNAWRQAWKKSG